MYPIRQTLTACIQQAEGFSSDAAILITDQDSLIKEAATLDIPVISRSAATDQTLADAEAACDETWPFTLVQWYLQEHRDLPWRRTRSPYAVWVSEIMLQQTRVEAVIGYYDRFMERFPTVEALAGAQIDEVLKYWEGLGYYSRARNLHAAAQVIIAEYGGNFPETTEKLRKLPGIGAYTAGAIASIAYGVPAAAVDGNVLRVLARLYALWDDILTENTKRCVTRLVEAHIPLQAAGEFTQSLMELGALVCIPQNPRCEQCPLRTECKANLSGCTDQLPIRISKTKVKDQKRVVYLIFNSGKVLMHKRPEEGLLGGLYEFPGVDVADRTTQTADQRFMEAYGLELIHTKNVGEAEHKFTHIHWHMRICTSELAQIPTQLNGDWLWADPEMLDRIMIPSAFKRSLELAKKRFS